MSTLTKEEPKKLNLVSNVLVWGIVALFLGACIQVGFKLAQWAIPSAPYTSTITYYHKVIPTPENVQKALQRNYGKSNKVVIDRTEAPK